MCPKMAAAGSRAAATRTAGGARSVPTPAGSASREDHNMYNIGEKPGKGRYCCTKCNWSATLDDASDRLPPCGNCGAGQDTTYVRCG